MKRMRKGFTLVELLIVITIIGMLSAMMMVSSTEAQNAARVTKINEGFRSLSAALMMYYNEDPATADGAEVKDVVAGAKRYIKNEDVLDTAETGWAGTYFLVVEGNTWWLAYELGADNGALNELLAKKAADLDLKSNVKAKPKEAAKYETGGIVYMNVL